uniref:PAZ domain-containing protein n=1 Tax=Meloidogyne enterolobii TaxID=390850 RepID=A0A6V7VLI7_MELEN|nr:unnamed protein product [Meloidogyne enterolobii]
MTTLLEKISNILDCNNDNVKQRLSIKCDRDRILDEIRGKVLKTTYFDRNGNIQKIYCDGLTTLGSHQLMAYGNLRKPFNISVSAYFHARHKILLKYPFHQCVHFKDCYYPLELLTLVVEDFDDPDSDCPITMKNLRKKASSSSESVKSIETISSDSTIQDCSSSETTPADIKNVKRGILLLYVEDKNLWEKYEISLYSSK